MRDIQVLSPGNRSDVGTQRLNDKLQERLNPRSPRKAELLRGRMYREGDRVLQMRNSYKTQVMNGEGGIIREINTEDQVVRIEFSGKVVDYDYSDLLDVVHGFAVSVHKSQGSEYPCVIMPVLETHYPLLSRALLYTGITRAKQRCILVGTRKAVGIAVRSVQTRSRYTQLDRRLTGEIGDPAERLSRAGTRLDREAPA
jgi:exodeoxyribonuclease V alpha subunit